MSKCHGGSGECWLILIWIGVFKKCTRIPLGNEFGIMLCVFRNYMAVFIKVQVSFRAAGIVACFIGPVLVCEEFSRGFQG